MARSGRGSGHSPANIAEQPGSIDFPASTQDLVQHARQGGTEGDAMDIIEQMPERTYNSMSDVMKGAGEVE